MSVQTSSHLHALPLNIIRNVIKNVGKGRPSIKCLDH